MQGFQLRADGMPAESGALDGALSDPLACDRLDQLLLPCFLPSSPLADLILHAHPLQLLRRREVWSKGPPTRRRSNGRKRPSWTASMRTRHGKPEMVCPLVVPRLVRLCRLVQTGVCLFCEL